MRLTQAFRNSIKRAAIDDLFTTQNARVTEIDARINKLATKLAWDTVPPGVRELYADPAARGYLSLEDDVKIAMFPDVEHKGNWWNDDFTCRVKVEPGIPRHDRESYIFVHYTDSNAASIQEIAALNSEKDKIISDKVEMKRRIGTVLSACTTTNRVIEMLPELAKYIPSEVPGAIVPIAMYETLRSDIQRLAQQNGVVK